MFGCFCLFFWGTRCWFLNSCRLLAVTPRQIGLVRDSCMYVSPRSLLFWERGSGIEKRGSPQVIVQTTGRSLEQLSDIWKDSAPEETSSSVDHASIEHVQNPSHGNVHASVVVEGLKTFMLSLLSRGIWRLWESKP